MNHISYLIGFNPIFVWKNDERLLNGPFFYKKSYSHCKQHFREHTTTVTCYGGLPKILNVQYVHRAFAAWNMTSKTSEESGWSPKTPTTSMKMTQGFPSESVAITPFVEGSLKSSIIALIRRFVDAPFGVKERVRTDVFLLLRSIDNLIGIMYAPPTEPFGNIILRGWKQSQ